jgi:chorismate mutase
LVKDLVIRHRTADESALSTLRSKIDVLDDELLRILDDRMKLAEEIGVYKKAHNMTILQPGRWNDILEKSESKAEKLGLSVEFIDQLFRAVHQESINKQEEIMK